jgi:NTP pyrophosphatase (non-canonical NTP hydrolase)
MDSLKETSDRLIQFRDERDWAQFHTPRNLASAIAVEAGELQETLLWQTDREVNEFLVNIDGLKAVERELADILAFSLLFCNDLSIDPIEAVKSKLAENAAKYPVDLSRGSAAKYTELRRGDGQ